MQVYLAGAIDRAKLHPKKWVSEIKHELLGAWTATNTDDPSCLIIFSPSEAYEVTGEISGKDARGIVVPNMGALENSDAVLCRYDPGTETWGTPMEVLWAHHMRIPVFVWTTEKMSPVGKIPDWSILPAYLAFHARNGVCYSSAMIVAHEVVQYLRGSELDQDNQMGDIVEMIKKGILGG